MKKLTLVLMSAMLVFALAACAANQQPGNSAPSSEPPSESGNAPSSAPGSPSSSAEEPESTSGKTLVVYFSATGNTKEAANYIAAATEGDVFELVPTVPYTDADLNYSDDGSRVVFEHDNPAERKIELVASTVPDWDSYDTVFIGYPIWWGAAAWPVDGFIEANDFTGKTVIPFCTSISSGYGESGELLEEQAGTGNWLQGERFPSSVSENDIRQWVEGLNL